jgi:hypothetical protein
LLLLARLPAGLFLLCGGRYHCRRWSGLLLLAARLLTISRRRLFLLRGRCYHGGRRRSGLLLATRLLAISRRLLLLRRGRYHRRRRSGLLLLTARRRLLLGGGRNRRDGGWSGLLLRRLSPLGFGFRFAAGGFFRFRLTAGCFPGLGNAAFFFHLTPGRLFRLRLFTGGFPGLFLAAGFLFGFGLFAIRLFRFRFRPAEGGFFHGLGFRFVPGERPVLLHTGASRQKQYRKPAQGRKKEYYPFLHPPSSF